MSFFYIYGTKSVAIYAFLELDLVEDFSTV